MALSSSGPQVGNMAKIFYIAMVDADTTQAFFFNNKKKAFEKGMELYDGFGEFSFDLDGEEFEGDYATTYIYSGIENVCLLYTSPSPRDRG